jgi:hypothetical protein
MQNIDSRLKAEVVAIVIGFVVGGGVAILITLLVDSVTMESAARHLDDPFTRFLQWLHTPIVDPLWVGVLMGTCLYAGARISASVLHRLQRSS